MGKTDDAGETEYLPPIIVTHESGRIRIEYDEVITDFPDGAAIPTGAPPLACRIFRALMCDLRAESRAE